MTFNVYSQASIWINIESKISSDCGDQRDFRAHFIEHNMTFVINQSEFITYIY